MVNLKRKENCRVIEQKRIGRDVYSLWLETKDIASNAAPGQFVMLYGKDGSRLLPRPISVCQTKEVRGKKTLLLGGGIGIPPMLEAAAQLKENVTAVLGYKDEVFLKEDFEKFCPVVYAIEDEAAEADGAIKGNVLDAVREQGVQADVIFACGPAPMLRAIQVYAQGRNIPCWISMEERMACGIGACLGCVCDAVQEDAHLRVYRKRVCKDGPVFLSTEVEL